MLDPQREVTAPKCTSPQSPERQFIYFEFSISSNFRRTFLFYFILLHFKTMDLQIPNFCVQDNLKRHYSMQSEATVKS
jgi:hypothetical protein